MKTTKLLLIALVLSAMAATSAMAQTVTRTTGRIRARRSASRPERWRIIGEATGTSSALSASCPARMSISASASAIRTYGYGYPYYGSYPYGYGYYNRPRAVIYPTRPTQMMPRSRLCSAGSPVAVIIAAPSMASSATAPGMRFVASNATTACRVDGRIDRRLLATMGLA